MKDALKIKNLVCLCGKHPWMDPRPAKLDPRPRTVFILEQPALLCGPPRTGSTRVHQAIEKILGKKTVLKTHKYFEDTCPFMVGAEYTIFCIRHPFDSLYSYLRYLNRLEKDDLTFEEIDEMFQDCIPMLSFLKIILDKSLRQRLGPFFISTFLLLRYEDFWARETKLVLHLASKLQPNRELSVKDIEDIAEEISLERNYNLSKTGGDDKIHLGHVSTKKGAPGSGIYLPRKYKKYIVEKYSDFFAYVGYDLNQEFQIKEENE